MTLLALNICRCAHTTHTTQLRMHTHTHTRTQIGWNKIERLQGKLFQGLDEDFIYLVHSFYAQNCKEAIATTDYDMEYASALQTNNFYGVQFHPEKSGRVGAKILENFLKLDMRY